MSGGGGTKVEKNEIDPQLKALYMQNYATAMNVANTPFQPYTGQRVAPLNDTQRSANDLMRNIAGNNVGKSALDQAMSAMGGMLSYQPGTISASPIAGRTVSADPISAGMLKDADLSAYMNPYTRDVIDASLADLSRARDIQRVADNQHATMAKAFGGSRQGVADSLTNDNYLRNVASTTANLRNTGYNAAVDAAMADINRKLAVDQFNSGQKFTADQFNAGQAFAADQFNSNQFYDAGKTNAANGLTGANFRMNAANALAGMSGQELSQALQRAGGLSAAGSIEQQMQQAQDDAAYEEFLRQIAYPQQQQDMRNSALGMIPIEQTATTTTRSSPNVAGMIGSGLSTMAMA